MHDIRLPEVTIKSCLARAPRTAVNHHEHLCLDKGYDSTAIRELVEVVYGYTSHIRFRGEERRLKRRGIRRRMKRWVVERTHGRLNRFRGILIRWEKKAENHLAALHLACAYYTYSKAGVFG